MPNSELGKKGYYAEKEETELGKVGLYRRNEREKPTEKEKSPASMSSKKNDKLILVIIIALLAIGGYFIFVNKIQPAAQGTASFNLIVASGEARVDAALVEVFDGEELIAQAQTDAQGKVAFESLPQKRLEFQISSPSGITRQSIDLSQRRAYVLNLRGKVADRDSLIVTLRDSSTREPVANAKIAYSLGSNNTRFFADSNSQGKASLRLQGETVVRLRVVDPQGRYESYSNVLLATRGPPAEILLQRRSAGAISFAGQNATLEVLALTQDRLPVAGTLVVSDFATGAEIKQIQIANGSAALELSATLHVSLSFNANGFYPAFLTNLDPTSGRAVLTLVPITATVGSTTVNVVDENGAEVAADVYVIPFDSLSSLISMQTANGTAVFSLLPNFTEETPYYAIAIAPGFAPGISEVFYAGQQTTITLASSAASLQVSVVDEDHASIAGANIAVLRDDGRLAALPKQSQFGSSLQFALPPGNYEVRASLASMPPASKLVRLVGNDSVELLLRTKSAGVQLTVSNLQDDSPVEDVLLTSFYNGQQYDSCTGDGGCTVNVRAGEEIYIQLTALDFLSTSYYAQPIAQGSVKRAQLSMVPVQAAQGLQVEFLGIEDAQGNMQGTALRSGEKYNARFTVSSSGAEKISLYVRVAGSSPVSVNASLSSVHLLELPSFEGVDVFKSSVYLGQHVDCVDLERTALSEPYAWVEVFYNSESQEISIPFEIPASAVNSTFTLYYRSSAKIGSLTQRVPLDPVLGFADSSEEKASCYADAIPITFTTFAQGAPQLGEFPDISADFTEGDALAFNPSTGQIDSQTRATQYDLQVDSLLPGDAMPLAVQADSRCTVLVSQPNSTQGSSETSSCYSYDSRSGMLVFRSRELNPLCPIHLRGDKFYNLQGNRVASDSAKIVVTASCAPEARREIPINVKFVSDVPSFALVPDSAHLAEGDAAKLLYLINNRFVSQRNVEAISLVSNASPQGKIFQFSTTGAKPLVWRGPGTLDIVENNTLLGEVTFADSSQAFRSGVGILGFRQTSCSEGDIYCCANGWCTAKALQDEVETFKETSQKITRSTAFRRGNGKPFTYFSSQQLRFVTVVQAVQNSQQSLTSSAVNFAPAPSTCVAGNPGVYELAATSPTGNDGTWNYSGRILELSAQDYLQPASQCGLRNNVTQTSLTTANGAVALCNFLSADNNCVESTPDATITSLDQVDKLRFSLTNCIYPVFPSAPVCPGTRMVLPAVNFFNYQTDSEFNASNSPSAFSKLFTAIGNANHSSTSIASWQGQLRCVVPPSFQQFAITAGSTALRDVAGEDARNRVPSAPATGICSNRDFYGFGLVPNLDTLIPLAGICCTTPATGATQCTPRRGKFFISVQGGEIKVITQWGLTEGCYPYWPLPTSLQGLTQQQNLVSVGFGLTQFLSSNGANFEMSLASQQPLQPQASQQGLLQLECAADRPCLDTTKCINSKLHRYTQGACVASTGTCRYTVTQTDESCNG